MSDFLTSFTVNVSPSWLKLVLANGIIRRIPWAASSDVEECLTLQRAIQQRRREAQLFHLGREGTNPFVALETVRPSRRRSIVLLCSITFAREPKCQFQQQKAHIATLWRRWITLGSLAPAVFLD